MFSSKFPEQLDDFKTFLDITDEDATYLKNYQRYMLEGNLEKARENLTRISNYENKIITANRLNQFNDALYSVEKFYKENMLDEINRANGEVLDYMKDFSYMGDYSPILLYRKNNLVSYVKDGKRLLYICVLEPYDIGISPSNDLYWKPFTIIGDKGNAVGVTATTFIGNWDNSSNYLVHSVVANDSAFWVALRENSNSEPKRGITNNDWELLFEVTQNLYEISSNIPIGQKNGDLWLEVIG